MSAETIPNDGENSEEDFLKGIEPAPIPGDPDALTSACALDGGCS